MDHVNCVLTANLTHEREKSDRAVTSTLKWSSILYFTENPTWNLPTGDTQTAPEIRFVTTFPIHCEHSCWRRAGGACVPAVSRGYGFI